MVISVVIVFGINRARFSIGSYSFVYVINEHTRIVSTVTQYTAVRARAYTHKQTHTHVIDMYTRSHTYAD